MTIFLKSTWTAMIALQFLTFVTITGQCRFNCLDTVNVSVNNLCNATVTPELILKTYDPATCAYGIALFDANDNQINLNATRADIGPQYVGQVLRVRVYEIGAGTSSPNSCWGYVNVEDKLPPEIFCVGNDTISCWGVDPYIDDTAAAEHLKQQIESTLVDNCGNEEVTVNITDNILTRMLCQPDFAAMRRVSYNVLDNNENVTTCSDTIYYERFPIDSIDAPKNFIDNMSINCTEPYPTVEYLIGIDRESPGLNSLPNINGASIADYTDSLFTERGLCNFKMTYTDLLFPNCGNTYKVVRNWTVIDWCNSSEQKIFNQVIKVSDTNISLSGIANIGPLAADDDVCTSIVELPLPRIAANECNDWSYTISIKEPEGTFFFPFGGTFQGADATINSRVFPIGVSTVKYNVTDVCGNTAEREFTVTIVDEQPPVAVCDYRTVVTLNDNFVGKAFAKSFDDNSYDHCTSIVSYKVRRMDRASTTCDTPQDYDDFVKFCCADIGRTVMVELQVTDEHGMTATCMAEAQVQFKGNLVPSAVCPADIAVQDCQTFSTFDISTLAAPVITTNNPCLSNLLVQVREVSRSIDNCGDGQIEVEWYYNISGDDQVVCANTVRFENKNIFQESNINWPTNRIVDSCTDVPPSPTELSNLIQDIGGCNNVIASEPVDRVFENVPGACRRIIRTWTVVDWCRYPADPAARWTYDQQIDITNATAPTIIVDGSNIQTDYKSDNCRSHVILTGSATDDCTPAEDMSWTHRIDRIVDGQEVELLAETNGRVFENRIDGGQYIVTWTAMDQCGNLSLARQSFTIQDETDPEAVCAVIVRDMSSDGVTVTAIELGAGSSDNCANSPLTYRIRRQGSNTSGVEEMTFACADLGNNLIEVIVTDESGNQSSCTASVDIRDGAGFCGFGAAIIGKVMTPDLITVEDASVALSTDGINMDDEVMTEVNGEFAFTDLAENGSYQLSVQKDNDYLNGVSTLDLILMQRHILGLERLDSPYKLIAADVDNNERISALDMVHLRRLLLGVTDKFSDNTSWRFLDASVAIAQSEYPWPLTEKVYFDHVSSMASAEVYGIKIGDIDGNATANSGFASARSVSTYTLIQQSNVESGVRTVTYTAQKDIKAYGYQLALAVDVMPTKVRGKDVEIVDDMLHLEDGLLKISVATARGISYEQGDVVLQLTFDATAQAGQVQVVGDQHFGSEIYGVDKQLYQVKTTEAVDELILHQNQPNPFVNFTVINFELASPDRVTLDIFDASGKHMHTFERQAGPGLQQVEIRRDELGLTKGIYYYQLQTTKRSLTKKMIIL